MLRGLVLGLALLIGLFIVGPEYRSGEVDIEAKKQAVVVVRVSGYKELDFISVDTKKTKRKRRKRIKPLPKLKLPWSAVGSGFFITGDGYIVTAAHVIDCPEDVQDCEIKVSIWGFPGREVVPQVVYTNLTFDIAVLKVKGANFTHFKFAEGEPRLGEQVFVLGHPRGLKWSVFHTAISNKGFNDFGTADDIRGKQISHWLYQLEKPIPQGISGGVVFNKRGELVCMPHAAYVGDFGATNFCVPGSQIQKVLRFIGI